MKNKLFFLLLLSVACGKAQKKSSAVDASTTEMTEEELTNDLIGDKVQPPVAEPVNDIKNPPAPPSEDKDQAALLPTPKPKQSPRSSDKLLGVGALAVITGTEDGKTLYNNCTATLIGENEVISANHCIPESEKGPDEFCSKMIFMHSSENRNFKCSKVLWSSSSITGKAKDKNSDHAYSDIVIFQLESAPLKAQALQLASTSTDKNSKLKTMAYSIQQTQFPKFTNIAELTLSSQIGFQYFFSSFSPCFITDESAPGYPFRAFDCPVVGGNSGAPVLNSHGQIQGIVGGCVESIDKDCFKGNRGGYMTDASCIQKRNGSYSWNPSCAISGPISSNAPLITRASQTKRSE